MNRFAIAANMMMCRVSAMCMMRVFCCSSVRTPIPS
jgi:hypothetical protein